jgi:AraC-like DNA-binding protein
MEKELHLRLLHVGLVPIDHSWNVRNVYSTYWRYYINNTDGAEVELADRRVPIPKNCITFIPAWVRFNCHNVRPIRHFYIHFDIVGISGFIVRKIFNSPITLPEKIDFPQFLRGLDIDVKDLRFTESAACLCRIKATLYHHFSALLENLNPEQKDIFNQSMFALNRFAATLQYIDNHLAQDLNNNTLAHHSHMSESHFAHCFHDLMGQTPARYVLERRIAYAARQLVFSQHSIDTIAERSGFTNRFHFSRNFTRVMGVPPAAYRKTTRVLI